MPAIYKAFNPETRKYEEVSPEGEFLPGARIVKMIWCQSVQKYVSIPGESLMVMTATGWMLEA